VPNAKQVCRDLLTLQPGEAVVRLDWVSESRTTRGATVRNFLRVLSAAFWRRRWAHRQRHFGSSSLAFVSLILTIGQSVTGANAQMVQEVRITWDASAESRAPGVDGERRQAPNRFTLLGRQTGPGLLARQRNPELSSDQIVVVAVDSVGNEIDRQLVADPRVVRTELPAPSGRLKHEVHHRTRTELMITLPDDPAIAEIRLYHPRWTGNTFALDLLGTVSLR
jgi:hypothetical protein